MPQPPSEGSITVTFLNINSGLTRAVKKVESSYHKKKRGDAEKPED